MDPISKLFHYAQKYNVRPEFSLIRDASGTWKCTVQLEGVDFTAEGSHANQKDSKKQAAEAMILHLEVSGTLQPTKRFKLDHDGGGGPPISQGGTYTVPIACRGDTVPSMTLSEIQGLWSDVSGKFLSVENSMVIKEDTTREKLRVEDGYFYSRSAKNHLAMENCGSIVNGCIEWSDGDRWESAASPPEEDVGNFNPTNAKQVINEFIKRKRLPELLQPVSFHVGSRTGFRAIAAFDCGGKPISVATIAQTKKQASIDLAIQLCRRLYREGLIGTSVDTTNKDKYPEVSINLNQELKNRLANFMYNCQIDPVSASNMDPNAPAKEMTDVLLRMDASGWACSADDISKGCSWSPACAQWDPWKYKPVVADTAQINQQMYARWQAGKNPERLRPRQELPIAAMENEIVELINNTTIVLVSGSTGSGKTTQIPQFILDQFIGYGRGSDCNIIVTQPRRVAAISIAERVAWERSEQMGESVGYSVRFDQKFPRASGSILYMTVGILLRKLESGLHGVSHIFIDEVHERDLNTDFLLVVVKRLAEAHPDIRVILMSATISLTKFTSYFPGSSIVECPGRNFPVETFFLEDAVELLNFEAGGITKVVPDSMMLCDARYSEKTKRTLRAMSEQEVNYNLVEKIIEWVMGQQQNPDMQGSVLIFLPGWEVISHMMKHLRRVFSEQCLFLPLHSQVPKEDQRRVFDPAPAGKIKVILSTNIAETSVTIRDVVYVIDSCRCKLRWFHASHTTGVLTPAMLSRLDVHWAAKHNLTQREGRAGRLRPGFCFRLCTKMRYDSLPETLPPEMVRAPLHDVALIVKWLQLGDIKNFLLQCPDPPKMDAIERAIITLQDLSALDSFQRLTPVGVQLARLPIEPRMGYALLMAALFGLAEPMSIIFATFCYKDPFGNDFRKTGPEWSDAFQLVHSIQTHSQTRGQYYNERTLNLNTLRQIMDAAVQLQGILKDMGFNPSQRMQLDPSKPEWPIAQYLLALGLDHWAIHKDVRRVWVGDAESGNIASNSACSSDLDPPEKFYTYFEQARNHAKIQCRTLSNVSLMPILLGSVVSMPYASNQILLDHWLPVNCRFDTAALLGAFRAGIECMLLRVSHTPSLCSSGDQPLQQFIALMYELLDPNTINGPSESDPRGPYDPVQAPLPNRFVPKAAPFHRHNPYNSY